MKKTQQLYIEKAKKNNLPDCQIKILEDEKSFYTAVEYKTAYDLFRYANEKGISAESTADFSLKLGRCPYRGKQRILLAYYKFPEEINSALEKITRFFEEYKNDSKIYECINDFCDTLSFSNKCTQTQMNYIVKYINRCIEIYETESYSEDKIRNSFYKAIIAKTAFIVYDDYTKYKKLVFEQCQKYAENYPLDFRDTLKKRLDMSSDIDLYKVWRDFKWQRYEDLHTYSFMDAVTYDIPPEELWKGKKYTNGRILQYYKEHFAEWGELCSHNENLLYGVWNAVKTEYSRGEINIFPKDIEEVDKLSEINAELTVKIPCYETKYQYRYKKLDIILTSFNSIQKDKSGALQGKTQSGQHHIVFYADGRIYQIIKLKTGSEKWIPMPVKTLCNIYAEYGELGKKILQTLQDWFINRFSCYFIKDICTYARRGVFLPPVTMQEVVKHTSFQHLFSEKYHINKNWNKNDVNWLYVLEKVRPYVTEKSYGTLLSYKDIGILNRAGITNLTSFRITYKNYQRNGITFFVTQWYKEKMGIKDDSCNDDYDAPDNEQDGEWDEWDEWDELDGYEENLMFYIKDYIRMCLLTKTKINLNFTSKKKLRDAHDKLANEGNAAKTGPVKVPKNSRFLPLRDKLPAEMEWIKTRKRLIKETEMQHHCVWSYAEYICRDTSAIYSFIYQPEGKRYTVEFKIDDKGKYYINQMQSACDRGHSKGSRNYVEGFLKQRAEKQQQSA